MVCFVRSSTHAWNIQASWNLAHAVFFCTSVAAYSILHYCNNKQFITPKVPSACLPSAWLSKNCVTIQQGSVAYLRSIPHAIAKWFNSNLMWETIRTTNACLKYRHLLILETFGMFLVGELDKVSVDYKKFPLV